MELKLIRGAICRLQYRIINSFEMTHVHAMMIG